ncbi:MAG: hypothetical protein HY665_01870, partial [Chloroflexi bacterium]|nr:hypothetical protein [Chloroflexota bacterium]
LAGYYIPLKELKVEYGEREVLCVVGVSVVESSCCGSGSRVYAMVPGYLKTWQNKKNGSGLPVSEVEPITEEAAKVAIGKSIKKTENVPFVDFW